MKTINKTEDRFSINSVFNREGVLILIESGGRVSNFWSGRIVNTDGSLGKK